MKYIRLGFVFLVLVIVFFGLSQMIGIGSLPEQIPAEVSGFQVTMISGPGNIYLDRAMSRPVSIRQTRWKGIVNLFADLQTAFEFYCNGTLFCAMPGSKIRHNSFSNELELQDGDFRWSRESAKNSQEVLISPAGFSLLFLGSGRIKINGRSVEIWNYRGKAKIQTQEGMFSLPKAGYVLFKGLRRERTLPLPGRPENLLPDNVEIKLRKSGDSAVRLSWAPVKDVSRYLVRIYTSRLREELLVRRTVNSNLMGIDLLRFKNRKDFYWNVTAVSADGRSSGIPSELKHISLAGTLLGEQSEIKPPELKITSLTVGGNILLIKGEAEKKSQLFINNQPVKLDLDGKFIHTLTFKTIGVKEILFRVVSPAELETVVKRRVAIFEDGI